MLARLMRNARINHTAMSSHQQIEAAKRALLNVSGSSSIDYRCPVLWRVLNADAPLFFELRVASGVCIN